MANKKEKLYGPDNNKVTIYLDKDWKHYDSLNKIKNDGGNVSKAFVTAYEKQIDERSLEDKIRNIVLEELKKRE